MSARLELVREDTSTSGFGFKLVALLALLVCGWILLKVVIGMVTTVAWIAVLVAAVLGLLWALSVLRR